jgi:transposase
MKDFNWPTNSPDLNPAEHMWPDMESGMNLIGIENEDQLFQEAKRAWEAIPVEVVGQAVENFRIRL